MIIIDNDYIKMWVEDGIMYNIYKPNLKISLEIAKLLVQDRLKLSNGVSRPLFVDISNMLSVDKAAREYLSSDEASQFVKAGAFYTTSPLAKFAGNIFLYINKPKTPAQIFSNKTAAIQWLQQYK